MSSRVQSYDFKDMRGEGSEQLVHTMETRGDNLIWTRTGKGSQFPRTDNQLSINPAASRGTGGNIIMIFASLFWQAPIDSTAARLRDAPTFLLHKTTVAHSTSLPRTGGGKWGTTSSVSSFSPGLRSHGLIFGVKTAALLYLTYCFIIFSWNSFECWCLSRWNTVCTKALF